MKTRILLVLLLLAGLAPKAGAQSKYDIRPTDSLRLLTVYTPTERIVVGGRSLAAYQNFRADEPIRWTPGSNEALEVRNLRTRERFTICAKAVPKDNRNVFDWYVTTNGLKTKGAAAGDSILPTHQYMVADTVRVKTPLRMSLAEGRYFIFRHLASGAEFSVPFDPATGEMVVDRQLLAFHGIAIGQGPATFAAYYIDGSQERYMRNTITIEYLPDCRK